MRRKWIKRFLNKRGLTIVPLEGPTRAGALRRLKARELEFGTVIDVGASNGCWTQEVMAWFPKARYLCIEAQAEHEPALKKLCATHNNVEYVIAAAGADEGKVYFNTTELFGGLASSKPFAKNCVSMPATTIDIQVSTRGLPPPYWVKLDTHGFEVPILTGAVRTLQQTEALSVEVYNVVSGAPALLFHEMCAFLGERGFRCLDLYDPIYRPADGMLWQMDMVFVRADRPEFRKLGYR